MPPSRLCLFPSISQSLVVAGFWCVSCFLTEHQTELHEASDALDLFTGRNSLALMPPSPRCVGWSPAGPGTRGPRSGRPRGRVSHSGCPLSSQLPSRAHAPRGAGTWLEAPPEAPPLSSTWAPGRITAGSPCPGPPHPARATTFGTPAKVPTGVSAHWGCFLRSWGACSPVFSGLDGSPGGPVCYRLPPQSQKGKGREF